MPDEKIFDIIIRGGTVIDGSGDDRFQADIGIVDDTIKVIGCLSGANGGKVIDATNRIVAPGFIDVHTHDDRILLAKPSMDMKVSQGVTSAVVGNCGISLAPLVADDPPPPLDLIAEPGECRFATFSDFLGAFDNGPAAVNAAFLVGHSTLRVGVMDCLDRRFINRNKKDEDPFGRRSWQWCDRIFDRPLLQARIKGSHRRSNRNCIGIKES